MSSPEEPDQLPDPRELFEQLEERERENSLPNPAELFRQMEAEAEAKELASKEAEELGVFGTFEGIEPEFVEFPEEELGLDLPMPTDTSPALEYTSDQTIGVDLPVPEPQDRLPDPAELFRQMQERAREDGDFSARARAEEIAIPPPPETETEFSIPAPSDPPLPPSTIPSSGEETLGLFQRLKNRFTKASPSDPESLELVSESDSESDSTSLEHSLPTPEELFRKYQEESEKKDSATSSLPTPEELFQRMQEEEMAEAEANGTELPQLPDLDAFKRQLEEEERANLDPDVLTDLSGPERFVPTVSDNIFSGRHENVLPGFRTEPPKPPEPPSPPEPEPTKASDDFFEHGDWPDFDEPEEPTPSLEAESEPELEPEPERSSPTGTVRVAYQSNEEEDSEEEFASGSRPRFDPDDRPIKKPVEPRRDKRKAAKEKSKKEPAQKRFSRYKLAIFTRQMSVMLKAGIQLHSAISFAAEADPSMRPLLETILHRVESGYTFSSAIVSVSRSFDPVYVGLIQAGEHSGRLPGMLERLADVLEKEVEMRKRLISTITYPIMLLLVCLAGTLGFMFFVLPTLEPLFEDLGVDLPLPTRILLVSRDFILPTIALTVLSTILMFLMRDRITDFIRARPLMERRLSAIPFQIPVFGRVYEMIVTSRVLYSLSVMLDVGITLNQALARSETTAGNALTAYRLGKARIDLADGVGVTDCFRHNELFTPSALHLISAGEEAAKLAEMFQYVGKLFDEEVEYALEGASAIMEPLIMVGMGLIVGFITISAAMPTIQLLQNFS